MELELGKVIATIINFLILYFILKRFFFDKIKEILQKREEILGKRILDIEEKEIYAENLLRERENLVSEARIEGKKIIEKRKIQGDRIYEELLLKGREKAQEIEDRKLRELELEKEKAMDEIKEESVNIAIALSEKIVEKKLDETEQKRIIDQFIKTLEVNNV
ncbi:MAG: F0F1 ATP synthase subunit B [Clostridium sp.]|uniref:F0F1 ATP synthase subunit B n=1 Tax=Clostridium sp. TaxID=1506 RepID=UPI003EE5816F